MAEALGAGTRFIGVGHALRRDDGVGPRLAAALARMGYDATAHEGDGAGLIPAFEDAVPLVIADAMQSGRPPGTILSLDACAEPLPAGLFRHSTHAFGLAEAVETARALGALPPALTIHGIEGADFSVGEGLSGAVAAAAAGLLRRLAGRA